MDKYAFADNFKRMIPESFNIPICHFYDEVLKETKFESPYQFSRKKAEEIGMWIERENGIRLDRSIYQKMLVFGKYETSFESPRKMMQFIGTDFLQVMYGSEYHVNVLLRKIGDKENIVVSDVRFDHEVIGLRKAGFKIISIRRPGVESSSSGHRSENDLDGKEHLFDAVVENNSGLDELYAKVDSLFLKLRDEYDAESRNGVEADSEI